MSRGHRFLEHTADIGIRATGGTLPEVFEEAATGLAELLGAWFPGGGDEWPVAVEAPDRDALLVAWLDELLFLHETEDVVFGGFRVQEVSSRRAAGTVLAAPRGRRELESVGVKAATYHRLRVEERPDGWVAEVYLDV